MTDPPSTQRTVSFFGGKGGVGKTTLAASYALLLAGRGHRTLVVSTDPAHSLGDVLAVPLGDEPAELSGGLWACEIDGESVARRRVEQVSREAQEAVPREVLPAVEQHLQRAAASPGTVESALVDRLTDLLDEVPARWDRIVVDSAPTGHMLRLLSLPTLLTPWIEGLVRQREQVRGTERMLSGLLGRADTGQDPLLQRLHGRRSRLERTRRRLLDESAVHLVLVPERLPLAETERAAQALADGGLTLGSVAVNRVAPSDATGLLADRARREAEVRATIRQRFGDHGVVEVPLLRGELTARSELAEVAEHLASAGW
ncbi:arsenite-transporting ATPase [Haloactinomyces albus]|uniref:Arsenite-transporting ATPase n=1 Tax=Haloactinomyces albus TaxID=1352928 RepID=A0AAE3ZB98_9ACTN|nr:ArsA family ATPase [Haloactinomyces albus]MDR7300349.1 arsenite-transporting ATPase [Haloactinomyces albus]